MNGRRRDRVRRILALALVVALIATMVISAVVTAARAEETGRDRYELELTWIEERQALRITQRLTYHNRTDRTLDRVMFSLYAELFRRSAEVSRVYSGLEVCPDGYAPGSAEIARITVNGETADYGMQGSGEYFLRVACGLAPGEECEFCFEYELLLTDNRAFCGVDEDTCRLSGFYALAAIPTEDGWMANGPSGTGRFALSEPADYSVSVLLPERYLFSSPGRVEREASGDGLVTWSAEAEGLREYACSFGCAWRELSGETACGTRITLRSGDRSAAKQLAAAIRIADHLEALFGPLPEQVGIAVTSVTPEALSFAGEIWLDREALSGGDRERLICRALAEQYFGNMVFPDPVADAWMNAAVCEYVALLELKEERGEAAAEERIRSVYAPALSVTIPGSYTVTTSAEMFTPELFTTVVRERGCLALHEVCVALGEDVFLAGLDGYLHGGDGGIAQETDLSDALSAAAGWDTRELLTDLLFGIDEYAGMYMQGYE